MPNKKYRYVAQRYTQGASPLELYTFCALAKDIRNWGGVPAKTEQFHGGFQRTLSPRWKKIVKYFEENLASPTSIVVAFREGALKRLDLAYPDGWVNENELSTNPQFALLTIEPEQYDESTDLKTLIKKVNEILDPRLKASIAAGNEEQAEEGGEDDITDDTDTATDEGVLESQENESEEELDVGHSKLRAFYDFINDDTKVENWVKSEEERYRQIAAKATKTAKETELIQFGPELKLKTALISLLRPAMIVDGQHRVSGACESANEIHFSVCAIRDADWVEQVFQFVILNKLAVSISGDFLTALLNTSLTNQELKDIEGKLETVGINTEDRVLMKHLNFLAQSPFFGLIADAGEIAGADNRGKLSARGMLRLARRWLDIAKKKKELQMFFPLLGVTRRPAARDKWRSGQDRMEIPMSLFYAFWDAIKELYVKQDIWEKGPKFHLLYIVTMHVLQDLFITTKSNADVTYPNIETFKEDVKRFFSDVPSGFFLGWSATGLQSGEGPKIIKEAIGSLREGTSLKRLKEQSPLFPPT